MRVLKFRAVGLFIMAMLTTACLDEPETRPEFTVPDGVLVALDEQVRMRDGVRLNTDVYLPSDGKNPVATILIRTPYDTELVALHQALLEHGYAIVEQHERGRYLSEGSFSMIPRPVEDGSDTLDWITDQPWSDGRVATIGCSSSAENQLKLAAANHPAHQAFVALSAGVGVAEAGPFKEQGNFWLGGVWQQGWLDYFYEAMHQDWPQLPAGLSDDDRKRQLAMTTIQNKGWDTPDERYDETRMHLPMIEIMDQLNAPRNEVAEYLMRGPSHPDWSKNRVTNEDTISIPGYWAEAIYDISARSTVAFFEKTRQDNLRNGKDNQSLRLTQGGHCTFGHETEDWKVGDLPLGDARFSFEDEIVAWLNAWMPVLPDAGGEPVFTGIRSYLADGTWQPTNALTIGEGAIWTLKKDGGFGTGNSSSDLPEEQSFVYNPADPVPSMGGGIGGTGTDHQFGSFDQSSLEARQDVLVFESEPVTAPLDLLGYARIFLTVSSDRPDTDFTVKIMDVYPDGRAFNIGDTIVRMRYRDGTQSATFMSLGERYDVELPPILLSRRIEEGHTIKVHVSSSNFPSYSRNLNMQASPYTSSETAIATNTVYFGTGSASKIEWPKLVRPAD